MPITLSGRKWPLKECFLRCLHTSWYRGLAGLLAAASLTACSRAPTFPQFSDIYSEPGLICWDASDEYPPWQPAQVVLDGEPPFTDSEVEGWIEQLASGRLNPSQLRQTIDGQPVLRLEYLVMDSGDFFAYRLSEQYELNYRDLFLGGTRERGYCIGERNER